MKVAILVDKFYPEIGGPYFILKQTVNSIKKIIKIKLIFNDNGKFEKKLNLNNILKKFDLIHVYGGWTYFHIKATYVAMKMKKKIIIHPLGYYEPWSLKQKEFKKRIAWNVYQEKILLKSNLVHCASANEKNNLLKLNNNFKIEILPYGIQNSFVKKKNKKTSIKKRAIFFSRIHKKKGIEDLIKAWTEINNKDWILDIIGPCDDKKYLSYLKKLTFSNNNIFFLKPIYSEKNKKILFDKYDFLALPTFNENFGMVILEALARGLPVLTNHNTPWRDIKTYNAGWFISDNYNNLLSCLRKIFNSNIHIFRKKSLNSTKLARNYNWDKLANDYVSVYKKVLKI
jgi:glycosyltransferase involved in cell wall biosynthesis